MSENYTWKELPNGTWDALNESGVVVAHVYTAQNKDLGLIYIAYAYSNPEDTVGCMSLDQAKSAAINLYEYPAEAESDTQEPKPQKINRLDPAWAQFAVGYLRVMDMKNVINDDEMIELPADFADAMLRERDRRDRGERE